MGLLPFTSNNRSYTPRIGRPPPPDTPSRQEMFALPDASSILDAAGRVVVICIANLALGFGIRVAFAVYQKSVGPAEGDEDDLKVRHSHALSETEDPTAERSVTAAEDVVSSEAYVPSREVAQPDGSDTTIRISQLFIYPVKACAGVSVDRVRVTGRGLQDDRLFMVVDSQGRSVTQKKQPRLTLVRPSFDEQGRLYLEAPGMEPFVHDVKKWGTKQTVTHLMSKCDAIDQGDDVANFFVTFLGVPNLRLVRMREGFVRKIENKHVKPGKYQTSFSDVYPFLMVSEASLADLSQKSGMELEVSRFRPNIVISGRSLQPWDEDRFKQIAVGEKAVFEAAQPCTRCKVVTVDPSTGILDENNQPTEALKAYRSLNKTVLFGQNLVPTHRNRVVYISIRDDVKIAETQEAPILNTNSDDREKQIPSEGSVG